MSDRTIRPVHQRRQQRARSQPKRDWLAILFTAVPAFVAVIGVGFTYLSVRATQTQVQITQQEQITDRYTAAITNLGSKPIEVRLGGVYALQRIMQDSPRDQPTVIAVLCAFTRDHTASPIRRTKSSPFPAQPTDIQAALTVIGTRDRANDGSGTLVNLQDSQLGDALLAHEDFSYSFLYQAVLASADIEYANLNHAVLAQANLQGAELIGANLTDANLELSNLTGADLRNVNLIGANLSSANLTGADLTGARFTAAELKGADLKGVRGLPANYPLSPQPSTPLSKSVSA
jgi:uncharacterized protein YjbI with pentapeptide repeats